MFVNFNVLDRMIMLNLPIVKDFKEKAENAYFNKSTDDLMDALELIRFFVSYHKYQLDEEDFPQYAGETLCRPPTNNFSDLAKLYEVFCGIACNLYHINKEDYFGPSKMSTYPCFTGEFLSVMKADLIVYKIKNEGSYSGSIKQLFTVFDYQNIKHKSIKKLFKDLGFKLKKNKLKGQFNAPFTSKINISKGDIKIVTNNFEMSFNEKEEAINNLKRALINWDYKKETIVTDKTPLTIVPEAY